MRLILSLIMAVWSITAVKAQIQTDTISIQGATGRLHAILQTPGPTDAGHRYNLVIVCHGFSGNCETGLHTDLAEDIVAEGMAALRFDFNGHGKSEGLFQNMTVLNEIDDLKSAIAWAQRQKWTESISLVGHSQGGVVASMVAGELGNKTIKAEVLMAPAAVLRDDAIRGNTMGAVYNPWNLKAEYIELPHSPESGALRLGKAYIESATRLPIYETAARYDGAALIVQGAHDRIVPYTYAERYHEKIKESELRVIPNENHGFSRTQGETARLVAEWLHKILM